MMAAWGGRLAAIEIPLIAFEDARNGARPAPSVALVVATPGIVLAFFVAGALGEAAMLAVGVLLPLAVGGWS